MLELIVLNRGVVSHILLQCEVFKDHI